ncbi:anti-sigma factor family protein [Nonomuraea rhodomycinica]|uniref:Zf-HC2 domain-containing protein n=1 Tax=Nonomuraea rhodomycinica TaxID=1712872 RepID=A0A7Y6MGF4_9ACTN|nr:zf-HC2 domain-containing protein [Nonomuraea rhodomycinica]NUW45844.1 zf-HC2 domain-containing protein [Nonomuraea rhodomycinica]
MTCEEVRISLGAHALGALEPDEALEIDAHLATCEACGAELVELEGVSAFLEKVSERDVQLVTSPPRQVLDRLLNARARRHRRGRMLMVVAASAAAIVAGGAVWTAVGDQQHDATTASAPAASRSGESLSSAQDSARSSDEAARPKATQEPRAKAREDQPRIMAETQPQPEASATPKPSARASGQEFAGQDESSGYTASVAVFPGSRGTGLSVKVSGVPVGTTCRLVVVGRDGRRDVTDSWTVDRENYQDKPVFASRTSIPVKDIARFEVVDASSRQVLVKVAGPRS